MEIHHQHQTSNPSRKRPPGFGIKSPLPKKKINEAKHKNGHDDSGTTGSSATILVSTKAKVRYKFVQNSEYSRYNLLLHFKYQYFILSVYIFYEKFYITLGLQKYPFVILLLIILKSDFIPNLLLNLIKYIRFELHST